MNYIFPASFMANTFAMTILLIILGLADKSNLAADVGIVQGATVALFYAFSANARSLILNQGSKVSAQSIMASRLVLLIPLSLVAYLLSVSTAGVERFVAIALILRRCVEWLGEAHLSEMELLDNKEFARNYLILQIFLLVVVLGWLLCDLPFSLLGLFVWALTPLILSVGYICKGFGTIMDELAKVTSSILPHLCSTAIIGVTVYVFRLLILLILGKESAGDLYTAFAIGGLTGGVFANVLGPSVALHEQRTGNSKLPLLLKIALSLALFLGIAVFASAKLALPVLLWTGKSYRFWMATGLSLVGGVIMVQAQRIRFRLLQHDEEHDVFGPDVMMNILLIAAVPFVNYLIGGDAMGGLYLLSSSLAFVFYFSSEKGKKPDHQLYPVINKIWLAIPVMLLTPVFFQLSKGVFRDPSLNFSSGGILSNLPVPLSVLGCYAGIIILGQYKRAFMPFATIFFSCVLMTMAVIISTQVDPALQQAKLILLVQFILPMFALVLGQVYSPNKNAYNDNTFARMFLWVLTVIMPLQLIAAWWQRSVLLVPSLGLFSIYQYLEYAPQVLVGAYLVSLFSLWQLAKYKLLLLVLAPVMAIYVAASVSVVAVVMLLVGFICFATYKWISVGEKLPVLVAALVFVLVFVYMQYVRCIDCYSNTFFDNYGQQLVDTTPTISEYVDYWKYYVVEMRSSPIIFFIGNTVSPGNNVYPTPHNYYLDFIYNFGLFSLIPVLSLLAYTCTLIRRFWREIYHFPALVGLCFVTLFLLFFENSLKVGLRQPYPGIFTFFLWGLLLNKLLVLRNTRGRNDI